MAKIMIVDDQRTARAILEEAVSSDPELEIAVSIENAALAPMYCDSRRIDLVLMDVYTANGESGLLAAAKIKRDHPEIKIIIVTSLPEHSFLEKARAAGCESFWYKDVDERELIEVLRKTLAGESIYPDHTPTIEIGCVRSTEFTQRELEVLRCFVNGATYREAAETLGISQDTLKYHVKNMLVKTGYKNTLRLAIDVVDKKLIIPGF